MTKTIEVSDEMYDKLIELATEMTTQDPRATRMPHMFQIRDWKKVYDAELNGDVRIFLDRGNNIEIETVEQLIDYLNDYEIEFSEDEVREMWDNRAECSWQSDIKDWLEERVSDLEEYSYSLVPEYSNCFLTAKAAQEHLDKNYYHYHKDADVYLNHAWRNPEADIISEFLCGLVGKEIHT
jgi:predicted transcriptional regulator